MPLNSAQKKHIRGLAMQIEAGLHIGREGITPALVNQTNQLLERLEMVKFRVNLGDRDSRNQMIADLANQTHSEVAGIVGKTASIYRYSNSAKTHILGKTA